MLLLNKITDSVWSSDNLKSDVNQFNH